MPAIIILGGHRSGTSVTARLIHELGFPAAPTAGRLLSGHPMDNPDGYYEDTAFLNLHRRMLGEHSVAHGGWKNPRRDDAEILRLRPEYRRRVEERQAESRDWSLKDPRLCLVGDVLFDVLDELAIEYRIVTTPRAIDEVVTSLKRRGLAEVDAARIAEMDEAGRRAVVQMAVDRGMPCLEISLASGKTPEEVESAVGELVRFLGRDEAAVG
ncbi:MAG TPA: hypothetical protein VM510_04945 [Caulifigura sp.]|nr:hypothetical protein [Caulifigura sp.]